jgi:hypothetical protein
MSTLLALDMTPRSYTGPCPTSRKQEGVTVIPWPWMAKEHLAPMDVRGLDDAWLANLARYRGCVAANTIPGHPDHEPSVNRLREVFDEMIRRQYLRPIIEPWSVAGRVRPPEAEEGKPQHV